MADFKCPYEHAPIKISNVATKSIISYYFQNVT